MTIIVGFLSNIRLLKVMERVAQQLKIHILGLVSSRLVSGESLNDITTSRLTRRVPAFPFVRRFFHLVRNRALEKRGRLILESHRERGASERAMFVTLATPRRSAALALYENRG